MSHVVNRVGGQGKPTNLVQKRSKKLYIHKSNLHKRSEQTELVDVTDCVIDSEAAAVRAYKSTAEFVKGKEI